MILLYNPYSLNYNSYHSNNTYNPYPPNYSPNHSYNTHNAYQHNRVNGITQCSTWKNLQSKWVHAHHKDLGKILLQVIDTSNCTGADPQKDSIGANFFYPGSCELDFSPDFSPLDLSAPVEYHGSIPPKHCRW